MACVGHLPWLLALLSALLPAAGQAQPAGEPRAPAQRVLLVSLDGLPAGALEDCPLPLPHLQRLAREGALVRRLRGVFPTVTYPAHVTLVTGCRPARHGVHANARLGPDLPARHPFEAAWIRVPTLWEAAATAGASTAAVAWPVTLGAPIDHNVPEVWGPQGVVAAVKAHTDARLMRELRQAIGPWREDDGRAGADRWGTEAARAMLAFWQPRLLLLHLTSLDAAQHESGPGSQAAWAALAELDGQVGGLLATLEELQLADETLLAVVGDHGFEAVRRRFAPNVVLARAGLLDVDASGAVSAFRVMAQVAGGGLFLLATPAASAEQRRAARVVLDAAAQGGLEWMQDVAGPPGAVAAASAAPGVVFSAEAGGPAWSDLERVQGAHGQDPRRPGLETLLLLRGPGIRPGARLDGAGLEDVAPTLAALAGWPLPQADGAPLAALFDDAGRAALPGASY